MYHLLETLLANTTTLIFVIVSGFVLLTLGADWLADGASALAKPPSRAKPLAWCFPLGVVCRVPDVSTDELLTAKPLSICPFMFL